MKKSVEIIYRLIGEKRPVTFEVVFQNIKSSPIKIDNLIQKSLDLKIPITIKTDKKGYLARQCPKCGIFFKIEAEDWEKNIRKSNSKMHCPICGCNATYGFWNTKQQHEEIIKRLNDFYGNYYYKEAEKALKDLKNDYGIEVDYFVPGQKKNIWHIPIDLKEELLNNNTCKKCNTRYAVIGSPFFCPCCGFYSLFDFLEGIEKRIKDLPKIKSKLIKWNKDIAEDYCRELIENSLVSIVTSFQKLASDKYVELNGKLDGLNDFQNISKGSELFEKCGYGYDKWLNDKELKQLNRFIQQRHLLVHTQGFINENYIEKSGDNTYTIGQRLVIKETDVSRLLSIVKKLGKGLMSLKKVI